ncbi:unnamed protein product [Caenorhabditis angaria]|uniref:Uncharacterized protein n=1 Tax=Caenorhabditis angaria TaxID=860376 RepID=A0A9P1N9F6_9PELO|nr:unnamed protein product [Caenorhabditis angaria]
MKQNMLLLAILFGTVVSKNVFVSSPFDNFRIECPKRAAATELAVRMVESVGQKRQDIVFDLSCETVEDLYPWINIPVGIADIEREDCHYSDMVDPILDENTTFTCAPREYLAGITRLSDTRIQTMCCKLRSRDEFNCKEIEFNKPIGLSRSTVIENDNQLINALRISGRNYVVRFCDLAPRANGDILADEKIKPKADPLKVQKTHKTNEISPKIRVPMHPPRRVEAVASVNFEKPLVPSIDLPDVSDDLDISAVTSETSTTTSTTTTTEAPTQPPTQPPTAPPTTTTTTQAAPVVEESTFPQETPIFSQQLVEDIVRKIGSAQSEQKAAQIFQQSLNKLLQNANEKPIDALPNVGPPAAMPPLRKNEDNVHFDDQQFPRPPAKQRFSKELLPLRRGIDADDLSSLQPVNLDGRRRSPIRTHRPHVDIWSSEEDLMDEVEGHVQPTQPPPRKIIKKIIKKVRPTTTTTTTTAATTTTEEPTTRRVRPTTRKMKSSFFSSMEKIEREQVDEQEVVATPEPRRFRGRTTTPSARRDLPARRKTAETHLNQIDNARDIDEETQISPFDDPIAEDNVIIRTTTTKKPSDEMPKIEFQEDEELEEVISKLSMRRSDIRRAPVRNTFAEAQFGEKMRKKDGVRTHVGLPIKLPNMEPISITNLEEFSTDGDDEDVQKVTFEQQDFEEAEDEDEKKKDEDSTTTTTTEMTTEIERITIPTTTVYDPINFYHTPRPRPMKKESILRFCSKESAIRDQSNMVIACGLDQDIWTPNRCPENTNCFPSHDSLYRICCPVHHG